MRAGSLRHNITVKQRDDDAQDAAGQPVESWVRVADLHASIEPLLGRELQAAQATYNAVTHKVTVRYYPGVTSAMRVYFGARFFNVVAVLNLDERNRQLTLMCEEGLGNA